jgi:hypothetical protein
MSLIASLSPSSILNFPQDRVNESTQRMFPLTTFLISIDNEESSCGRESNDHTVTIKWTNHLANEAFGKVDWAALHRCGVRRLILITTSLA